MMRWNATCAAALGVVVALGACKKQEAAQTGAPTSMMKGGETTAMETAGKAAMPAPMTDEAIFAMLSEASTGEIDAGKMAESKATNADVKAFARAMVTAHTKMLNDAEALAKRLKVVPKPMADDSMPQSNMRMSERLRSAAKGMTFDTAYLNGEVTAHEAVLDMVKRAEGQAQHPELKKFLQGAESPVQQHLDRAKSLQKKMG
jgi:putative membrane protein